MIALLRKLLTALINALEDRKGAKKSINEIDYDARADRRWILETTGETFPRVVLPPAFEPKDVIRSLPVHTSRVWKRRDPLKVNKLTIHQAMSKGTVSGIARYHSTPSKPGAINHLSSRGAPGIAYHGAVAMDKDATCYLTNHFYSLTWHTRGINTGALGLIVIGDFNGVGYRGGADPTQLQLDNLGRYVDWVLANDFLPALTDGKQVGFHSQHGKPACPGIVIEDFIKKRFW